MPKRGGDSGNAEEEQEMAALEAITNEILKQVKEAAQKQKEKPKVVQIIIYESSV